MKYHPRLKYLPVGSSNPSLRGLSLLVFAYMFTQFYDWRRHYEPLMCERMWSVIESWRVNSAVARRPKVFVIFFVSGLRAESTFTAKKAQD